MLVLLNDIKLNKHQAIIPIRNFDFYKNWLKTTILSQ